MYVVVQTENASIDVLFYRQQVGEYDVGDVIKRVSDLAFEKMVEADVLLEDHRTYMDDMFRLEHFMEVISDVYKKNKEIRSAEFSKSSSAVSSRSIAPPPPTYIINVVIDK